MKPPLLPLWTALAPLFLTSLLTPVATQGIQGFPHIIYSSLELPDMLSRAHFAKKMACRPFARSGARYSALPHCSRPLPSTSGHLEPPQRARRCSSVSSTRQPVVPLLLLPPPAPARTRASRPSAPVSTLTRVVPLAPCSLSLSPFTLDQPHKHPRHAHARPRDPQ